MKENIRDISIFAVCILALIALDLFRKQVQAAILWQGFLLVSLLLGLLGAYFIVGITKRRRDYIVHHLATAEDANEGKRAGLLDMIKFDALVIVAVLLAILVLPNIPDSHAYDAVRAAAYTFFVLTLLFFLAHGVLGSMNFRRRLLYTPLFDMNDDWSTMWAYDKRKTLELLEALWLPIASLSMFASFIVMVYGRAVNGAPVDYTLLSIGGAGFILSAVWTIAKGASWMKKQAHPN